MKETLVYKNRRCGLRHRKIVRVKYDNNLTLYFVWIKSELSRITDFPPNAWRKAQESGSWFSCIDFTTNGKLYNIEEFRKQGISRTWTFKHDDPYLVSVKENTYRYTWHFETGYVNFIHTPKQECQLTTFFNQHNPFVGEETAWIHMLFAIEAERNGIKLC